MTDPKRVTEKQLAANRRNAQRPAGAARHLQGKGPAQLAFFPKRTHFAPLSGRPSRHIRAQTPIQEIPTVHRLPSIVLPLPPIHPREHVSLDTPHPSCYNRTNILSNERSPP